MSRGARAATLSFCAALFALGIVLTRKENREPRPDAAAPAASLQALSDLKTLKDILRSHNDNDERLNGFDHLSPETKRLFRTEYSARPREQLNERGTIVYLLGKNIDDEQDWAFFRSVISEPPCLSLENCAKKATGQTEPGDEVTLAYPSLVALKMALRSGDAARAAAARALGAKSASPAVRRLAAR